MYLEAIDSTKPQDIVEEEELERISSLLQRDNLVRGLGVVEHVYRLLHCTPGTVGVMKNADRQPNVSSQEFCLKIVYHITQCLYICRLVVSLSRGSLTFSLHGYESFAHPSDFPIYYFLFQEHNSSYPPRKCVNYPSFM